MKQARVAPVIILSPGVQTEESTMAEHPPEAPPATEFPRLLVASAMLWGTPHSAYFRPGFRPQGSPEYTACGFFENAPLVPADTPDPGSDDLAHFPKAWFEDLKAAGIDAVDHCYFDSTPIATLLETLDAARDSGTGVRVFPMMDNMPQKGPTFLVDLWQNERLRTHPNLLRVDQCPVVITFDTHGAEVWRKRLTDAAQVGGQYFVISDTSQIIWDERHFGFPLTQEKIHRLQTEIEPINGLYCFADWSPPEMCLLEHLMAMGRSFDPPKLVGGCVVAGYTGSTRQGIIHDLRGTDRFRRQWLDVIKQDPGFVYVTTLNDYTEATEQECSANSTYAFIDLNGYFGGRWKTGQWPALAGPQAFLSYRKAVAVTEAVEIELVLLRPEVTGAESREDLGERFQAQAALALNGTTEVKLTEVTPEALPGHVVWRFWHRGGLGQDGYAVPAARITVDGESIRLPDGPAAPFAVVRNGEQVARRWLHVPLHRIRQGIVARLMVTGTAGSAYPRTILVEGMPWDDVACAVLEREANPLSPALTPGALRAGFTEEPYFGPGWCPMSYADGNLKRNIVDQVDRYTAVVRMQDNTFVFPTPALLDPPRRLRNEPYLDPATVMDLVLEPGDKLVDRGWLRRDLALPDGHSRPAIGRDGDGPWFLSFDGADDAIRSGPIFMPPGPATVELLVRPGDTQRTQTLFDSSEPVLSLVLMPGGTLRLLRLDQQRKEVVVGGRTALRVGNWHHVVAVFTGSELRLYVDGRQDAAAMPIHGLRSDKESALGGPALWAGGIRAVGHFRGDIAACRVLQRFVTPEEVVARYAQLPALVAAPSPPAPNH